jgi:hypothetical protein
VGFGDILDEWERSTARAYGKKKMARDARASKEERAPQGDDAAPREAQRGAPRAQDDPPRANPIDVWLRRHGTVDKDEADEVAVVGGPRSEGGFALRGLMSTILAGCIRV